MKNAMNEEDSDFENIEDENDIDDEYFEEEGEEEYEEEVIVKDRTRKEDLIVQGMANFLRIFGDYSRIKIIESIMDIDYTVGDIAIFTGLSYSAVSHHLKILTQAKLVDGTREGKYVHYAVVDKHVKELYKLARTHIEEFKKVISAREEYDEMAEIFYEELDL